MNTLEALQKLEGTGTTLYGGGMFEDVEVLGNVTVNKTDCLLEMSSYDKLQLRLVGDKTAYITVKSVKNGDVYTQPRKKNYDLVLRRVKNYGAKTLKWLQDAGIDPDVLKPGTTFVHAV